MEWITGVNDACPQFTSIIESLFTSAEPVILTVNSEPQSVLLNDEEYRCLRSVEKNYQRLALQLALPKIISSSVEENVTELDVLEEMRSVRKHKRSSIHYFQR
jgi:PHD/YefM family antitoxin component YafN of YafNO toxin-antitoxin module